jgi:VanZ family protein
MRSAPSPMPCFGWINLLFAFLSVAYISVIFLFADSPALSRIALFNPFSILHIPLYLILTILIVLSIVPLNFLNYLNPVNPMNQTNQTIRFLIAGFISFVVAVADEYHQSFIPTREASFTDVLLDVTGIVLALWLVRQIYKRQVTCKDRSANSTR